jgi:phage regulator Rha-like protein
MYLRIQTNQGAFMLSIVSQNNSLTMSHIQIADIVGSRPDSVKRTMKRLSDRGVIKLTPVVGVNHLGQHVNEYHVDKRNSYIVVAQLSPEFTAVLVDRWQELEESNQKRVPQTFSEALMLAAKQAEEIDSLNVRLDDAVRTKAQIGDKRTATLMNKASQDAKKIKKLEQQLQDVGDYQSIIAAGLPERVETELNPRAQTWRVLKKISNDMGLPPKKVKDERYGEVNTYHVKVIEEFKNNYLE